MEKKINTLEERLNSTKPLGDPREKESELERQNEKDKAVINDKNASPSEKEAPEARVAEREEELAWLEQRLRREKKACPFLEE